MANKLLNEKSSYLRQHSSNPVNWYPWSEEAFDLARKENKPVLLSIGYSSCHWCHVMAHESFEDSRIAGLLNENFISVKVDKEEYPDVDGFYMEFSMRNFGMGGWPLNVFLNHKKAPFYSITYLPKNQFALLLDHVFKEYSVNKKIQGQELETGSGLRMIGESKAKDFVKSAKIDLHSHLEGPQFPNALLLSYGLHKGIDIREGLLNISTKGLFDHIEGGWFRYTVDSKWKVPHFEKMLYDQATLLFLCAEAYAKYKHPFLEYSIRNSIYWLENKMRLPSGLYGSATDADTRDGEGFYYTIENTNDSSISKLFNFNQCGIHEGRLVPWIDFEFYNANKKESKKIIDTYRKKRESMEKPALDDKSVMSWNCFLGYSFLKCAEALGDKDIENIGLRLFENVSKHHVIDNRHYHAVYGGEPFQNGDYLEDYSSYLLLLSEMIKLQPDLAEKAASLIGLIKNKFIRAGSLTSTTSDFENAHMWQDHPFPSGGSMLLNALVNLNHKETKNFVSTMTGISETAASSPMFFSFWLYGFSRYFSLR